MEIQSQANELKLQMSSIKERLSVEFEVDISDLEEKDDEHPHEAASMSDDELREKVSKFKKVLESIGPINPMAMEAFDEINERYVFIPPLCSHPTFYIRFCSYCGI